MRINLEMEQEFYLHTLKEMALADLVVWKSTNVKYKSQMSKVESDDNLTEEAYCSVLMFVGLFDHSRYDENNADLCKYVEEIEVILNSDSSSKLIFENISQLEMARPEKDFITKIIEIFVPTLMIIGLIVTFINWGIGGKIFLSGIASWGILNGVGILFHLLKSNKQKPIPLKSMDFIFTTSLILFFFSIGIVVLYFIISK